MMRRRKGGGGGGEGLKNNIAAVWHIIIVR